MSSFDDSPWLRGIEGESARDLITSDDSLIRVVSGPGSGKTTCLKRRTQRLIDGDNVEPGRIFVGTFTRAVTQELKEALGDDISVSTLHSLARSLLQNKLSASSRQGLHFLLEFEQDAMLYDVNANGSFSYIGDIRKLRKELLKIQSCRSKRSDYENAAYSGAIDRWLRRYETMLIGEVVFRCVSAMESGDVATGQFDHVVIDEYQDLTIDEHELVQFLWSERGSLTVLGDDDQSIYGFRFNDLNGISKFGEFWASETVKHITFEENRRCGDRILQTANLMMAETGSNKPPMIPKSGRVGNQAFVHWDNIDDELSGIAKHINDRKDETFLVLVPRRFVGYQLAEMIGSDAKTYFREETVEHDIAQEAFAAACLLANPDDRVATRVWLGFHGTKYKQADKRNTKAVATLPNDVFGRELLAKIVAGNIDVSGDGQLNVRNQAKRALCLFERNWEPREAIENLFSKSHAIYETDEEKRRWLESDLLDWKLYEPKSPIEPVPRTLPSGKRHCAPWLWAQSSMTQIRSSSGRDVLCRRHTSSTAPMSVTAQERWTGMIARVRSVIAAAAAAGSMHRLSGSTSTKIGTALMSTTAPAVVTQVRPGTITSSPACTPAASSATRSETVPFITQTPCAAVQKDAKSAANCRSIGPSSLKCPPRSTSVTSSRARSSACGQRVQDAVRTGLPPLMARVATYFASLGSFTDGVA